MTYDRTSNLIPVSGGVSIGYPPPTGVTYFTGSMYDTVGGLVLLAPCPWPALWWWRGEVGVWGVGDGSDPKGQPLSHPPCGDVGPSTLAQDIGREGFEFSRLLQNNFFQGSPPRGEFVPQTWPKFCYGNPLGGMACGEGFMVGTFLRGVA